MIFFCFFFSEEKGKNKIVLLLLGVPASERFSFCLNTLLSDIAVNCPDVRDTIIENQVSTLDTLTTMIKSSRESNALPPINLCKATVPILLGLGRAMGRYAHSSPPLLCRIFPPITLPSATKMTQTTATSTINHTSYERQQSLSQFRSIIPRSLSGGLSCEALDDSMSDDTDSTNRPPKLQSYYSVPYDPTTYFFSKYGSSFNQFPNMRFYDTPEKKLKIQFKIQYLQSIFAIAKKLLTKETLEHLDEQASDIYSLHQIKSYPYKSFSETINLVLVTLLREVLQNETDLPTPFTKDVQEFVKNLFLNGQTELQKKQNDQEKEHREPGCTAVNKYKINVMANAACVDLLVWAINDETGKGTVLISHTQTVTSTFRILFVQF